ncbi:MAG: hypothetical protein Ct9H300mP8_01930 [Gammaproteobacteria bacterium]|nr:MAG: hypothetical protein Ct9H300mP8_01930 [Gammaproteobacteria bacterium]
MVVFSLGKRSDLIRKFKCSREIVKWILSTQHGTSDSTKISQFGMLANKSLLSSGSTDGLLGGKPCTFLQLIYRGTLMLWIFKRTLSAVFSLTH